MLRRLAIPRLLCLICSLLGFLSTAYAGFYLAPTVVYEAVSATNVGYNGIGPRLTLGYEDMLTQYIYNAAEIFTTPTTFKVWSNPNDYGSLKESYSYGISVIPGFNLDNTIVAYGRLGYIRTRFENLGKVKGGTQYGVGVQWVITDCWRARIEYAQTKYNNIANIGHPDTNTYMLGLMYRLT